MMKPMDNRAYDAKGVNDSDDSVRRAGGMAGNDPRRVDAQIVIDRKIMDHDQSGYNHNSQPDSQNYAAAAERKAMVWAHLIQTVHTKNKT